MSLFHVVWEIFPQTICSYHLTGCYIAERSLMGTQFMVNVKKKKKTRIMAVYPNYRTHSVCVCVKPEFILKYMTGYVSHKDSERR